MPTLVLKNLGHRANASPGSIAPAGAHVRANANIDAGLGFIWRIDIPPSAIAYARQRGTAGYFTAGLARG